MLERMLRTTFVALLIAVTAAMGTAAPASAATRVPRVAFVVGPAGAVTARYRALANDAADAARKAGAEVVKVYSPNATWPAVQRAVEGASLVVYLGHGNGWPSRYRDALYPRRRTVSASTPWPARTTATTSTSVRSSWPGSNLAPNAVVVFSHLCYASGNSEPGLPEGTRDQAIQRVDNYAAGFLRAGASAVIADAYLGPTYYVSALLNGRGSVESIWSKAPSANGHAFAVGSVRTSGYAVHLDPDRASGGYVRSLVSKGVTAAQLRAGAVGIAGRSSARSGAPSLVRTGVRFGEPSFKSLPIADTSTRLTLPLSAGHTTRIPAGTEVSVRWDPILLDPAPAAASPTPVPSPRTRARPVASPTPAASPSAAPTGAATSPVVAPAASPAALATPEASPSPTPLPEAPSVDLVVPEQLGGVVEPAKATRRAGGLRLNVRYPSQPGLYRMSVLLHTPQGVAYDAVTQDLLTPVLVRVNGPIAAAYGVAPALTVTTGLEASLPVRVMNAGSTRWDQVATAPRSNVAGEAVPVDRTTRIPARLVATWISADGQAVPASVTADLDSDVSKPGGATAAVLTLVAPATPGDYLLLLDVVSPANGSMSSLGSAPAIVRVTVAPVPEPSPVATPVATPVPRRYPRRQRLLQQPRRRPRFPHLRHRSARADRTVRRTPVARSLEARDG